MHESVVVRTEDGNLSPEMLATAKPPFIEAVTRDGGSFARFYKGMSGLVWAMGAGGVVEVDGQTFGEPRVLPHSWTLRSVDPDEHFTKRMYQTIFPFGLRCDASKEDLAIAAANASRRVIHPVTAKMMIMASVDKYVNRGGLAKATFGQIARFINPNAGRWQQRHFVDIAHGFEELDSLHVFPPDGRKVRVFEVEKIADMDRIRPEMDMYYGFTRLFHQRLLQNSGSGVTGEFLKGNEYFGWYLINLSGLMETPNDRPALMRYYLRFAAELNSTCGNYDRLVFKTPEELAIEANDLSKSAVAYRTGSTTWTKSTGRAELAKAKERAVEDLRDLQERGMWVLEEKDGLFRRTPTGAHIEAWKRIRKSGGRALVLPHTPTEHVQYSYVQKPPKKLSDNATAARANMAVPAILEQRSLSKKEPSE